MFPKVDLSLKEWGAVAKISRKLVLVNISNFGLLFLITDWDSLKHIILSKLLTLNPIVWADRLSTNPLVVLLNYIKHECCMEELLAESKIELLKEGSVITGTIMEIEHRVVIDFGGKAEGPSAHGC